MSSSTPPPSHCCNCEATIASMKKQEEEMLKMADVMCEKMRTTMKQYVMDVMQHHHDEMAAMVEDEGEKQMEDEGVEEGEVVAASKEEMMKRMKEDEIGDVVDFGGRNHAPKKSKKKKRGAAGDDRGLVNQNEGGGQTKKKKEKMQLRSFLKTSRNLHSATWSHDGKTIYVASMGQGEAMLEIDVESGKVIRNFGNDMPCYVHEVKLSKSGDLYYGHCNEGMVFVISSTSGEIIRKIESGAQGWFYNPHAICIVEEWNEVFVCDWGHHRIQVFSTDDGHFIREFGSGGRRPEEMIEPFGIAVDASAGLVFVSDKGNDRIQVFDRYGKHVRFFGDGTLNAPRGMVLDPETNQIIVCDNWHHRLCRFDCDGNFKASINAKKMKHPCSVSMNNNRQILATAFCTQRIFFFDNDIWSDRYQ